MFKIIKLCVDKKNKESNVIFILSRYINYKKHKLLRHLADWTYVLKCHTKHWATTSKLSSLSTERSVGIEPATFVSPAKHGTTTPPLLPKLSDVMVSQIYYHALKLVHGRKEQHKSLPI